MKRILLLALGCSVSLWADAQALMGTTGLLHAPTADMQRDKTFLFGGNYLNTHPLSTHFRSCEVGYTFNYYINITMFPWLEVSYICTLVHADHGSTYFPEQSWGKFTNQDRVFSARLRLWKEGWWKEWTPQIVLGLDDPTSHADHGGGELVSGNTSGSNNYATRYYLAVTKHLNLQNIGEWGVHAAFVYGNAKGMEHYKRPSFGINFRFAFPETSIISKAANGLNLMAEYDARTCNVGFEYSFWKDYVNLVAELNNGKYFSGGLVFKIHLKWFASGTPTYLVKLLRHNHEQMDELTGRYYDPSMFVDYKADVEKPLPMIYQSGYLTIKEYDPRRNRYLLDFPNNEVKKGFLTMVAANYFKPKEFEVSNWIVDAVILLEEGETTAFCSALTSFLADIPYDSHGSIKTVEATEKHFQYTFYLILRLLGVYCQLHVEKTQSRGRVDCVLETKDYVYIFEFKLDGTAAEALQQIEDKGYAIPYQTDTRKVTAIGISFSSETMTVEEWEEKTL